MSKSEKTEFSRILKLVGELMPPKMFHEVLNLEETKRKFAMGIPFTEEERKLVLAWKIKQLLKDAGGEMTVGELYEKLGVKPNAAP